MPGNANKEQQDSNVYQMDNLFCCSRARKDLWNQFKLLASLLCERNSRGNSEESRVVHSLRHIFDKLFIVERYWAFPGIDSFNIISELIEAADWVLAYKQISFIARLVSTDHYRSHDTSILRKIVTEKIAEGSEKRLLEASRVANGNRRYFEVLVVDSLAVESESSLRASHFDSRRDDDEYIYDIVVASSWQDAVYAAIVNYTIQACIIRYSFPFRSEAEMRILKRFTKIADLEICQVKRMSGIDRSTALATVLKAIRPELDLYLLSESPVEDVTSQIHKRFKRCFFGSEDYAELRLTLLKGIHQRYETPFFNALKSYAQRPTGVFHALPISRSKSITKSHWIRDYGYFYGDRIFLAETSTTIGGLDSLLSPTGSLLRAQQQAAEAFGSRHCLFVTNGTSTANKIVIQGVTSPGDIILMASDNHKSHHYGAMLSGVRTKILPAYHLPGYLITGAVPLCAFKQELVRYRSLGQLHKVKAIILTNLTFDGIAYDLERLFEECLAIKPDIIFIVDEAWFAYGMFSPTTRRRSAMHVAERLRRKISAKSYRKFYDEWRIKMGDPDKLTVQNVLDQRLYPNPDSAKIRVYSTQSTHKTLTALRQAAMIHINDDLYDSKVCESLLQSYQCHTSTSANYQILASLDIARRQVHFEGYELVQKAYELSFIFRASIETDPLLGKYFRVLRSDDMIPGHYRQSGNVASTPAEYWIELDCSWAEDEFALDPSRITIDISRTGISGAHFKEVLMNRFDIQVNKVSRTTVLVIIHIGSTRGMIAYFIEALATIAREIEDFRSGQVISAANYISEACQDRASNSVGVEAQCAISLPAPAYFYSVFSNPESSLGDGNTRLASSMSKQEGATMFVQLDVGLISQIDNGSIYVSASMITPYPPGSCVLLPGQVITSEIVRYLLELRECEIHGLDGLKGLKVFRPEYLDSL